MDDDTLSLDDLELSELTPPDDEDSTGVPTTWAPSEVSILLDLDEASSLSESAMPEMPASISLDESRAARFRDAGGRQGGHRQTGPKKTVQRFVQSRQHDGQAEAAVDSDDSTSASDSEFSADELQAQLDELSDLSSLDSDLDAPAHAGHGNPGGVWACCRRPAGAAEGLDQPISLDESVDATNAEVLGRIQLRFGVRRRRRRRYHHQTGPCARLRRDG